MDKRSRLFLLAVFLLVACPPILRGQETPVPPEVRAVVEKMATTIKGVNHYRDEGKQVFEQVLGEQTSKDSIRWEAAYADGNLFRLTTHVLWFVADGERLVTCIPSGGQYAVRKIEEQSLLDMVRKEPVAKAFVTLAWTPALLLLSDDPAREYLAAFSGIEFAGEEKLGDVECIVMKANVKAAPMEDAPTSPATIWHRKQDGLILRVLVDNTEAVRKALEGRPGAPDVKKLTQMFDSGKITVNTPPKEGEFTFVPPRGAEEVKSILPRLIPPALEMFELSGRPAPDFELETLGGETVKLSELKGRVVVLDFWATWCSPCQEALPKLNKVHEEFAGEDVVILGVNAESGNRQAVARFWQDYGLTFRTLLDPEHKASGAYGASQIPYQVLIDKDGLVQGRHRGFLPGAENQLIYEIDQLLKDVSLVHK